MGREGDLRERRENDKNHRKKERKSLKEIDIRGTFF